MSSKFPVCASLLLCFIIAACSSSGTIVTGGSKGRYPDDNELPKGDQGVPRKIGNPYKVAGKWYYPKEQPGYDEVGIASWYGQDFHGKLTANGEYFNMNALTAAHKTLPLPTFVKVTNLENGRSINLRVNDRGPFVGTRLIDVSRRGAQLLGFDKQGTVRVRVQAVDENGRPENTAPRPNVAPTQVLVADQLPLADSKITQPEPQVQSKAPAVSADNMMHFIQVGAFSQQRNANIQAKKLQKSGHRAIVERIIGTAGTLWRVRVGPFVERLIAEQRLDRIVSEGFYEARIFTESVK